MKRLREEEEEEVVVEFVDWIRLFHIESILMVLHPYLSIQDLIHLSQTNKNMNTTWINNERRLSVLGMRERVFVLLGRSYNVKNPVLCVKKLAIKSLRAPAPDARTFKCWYCSREKRREFLATNRQRWKYATCRACAIESLGKHYVHPCGLERFYYYIMQKYRNGGGAITFGNIALYDTWFDQKKEDLTNLISQHGIDIQIDIHTTCRVLNKSYMVPFIEEVQKNVK